MQQRRQQVGTVNKVGVPSMGCHGSLSRDMLTVTPHLPDVLGSKLRVVNELRVSADLALSSVSVAHNPFFVVVVKWRLFSFSRW
jgi:hypothetical protein